MKPEEIARIRDKNMRDRVHAALQLHCNFIEKMQKEKRVFNSRESFEKGVVDKLNDMCINHGVPLYFSHNEFTGTYCSVKCSCCLHKALLWFNFEGGRNSGIPPFNIQYKRPPYGLLIHRDVERHDK